MARDTTGLALTALIVLVIVLLVAALALGPLSVQRFSFEGSMGGWTLAATGILLNGTGIDWFIRFPTYGASHGNTSLMFYLDKMNDAGKIWIERPFALRPDAAYRVTIEAIFVSAGFGQFNHWRLIAGAFPKPPTTAAELTPAFRDSTGNGASDDVGYVWLAKRYTSEVRSSAASSLVVVFGIWGTCEGPRTYYVDDGRAT